MGRVVNPVAAEGGASLDQRTELPYWSATVYPEAAEATITLVSPGVREPVELDLDDEERARRNHERATRRATTESRRFMVANRLRYMWVLTFASAQQGAESRRECMREVAAFAERLRARFGKMPYWYSPEIHPGGHGWHVNFFIPKRLPHREIQPLWGHGIVWVKDWARDSRVRGAGVTFIDALRLAAQYGCKYASKDWSEEVLHGGAHRYEIAQGYKPRSISVRADSVGGGLRFAASFFGGRHPDNIWRSDESDDWDGPPVWCVSWSLDEPEDDG